MQTFAAHSFAAPRTVGAGQAIRTLSFVPPWPVLGLFAVELLFAALHLTSAWYPRAPFFQWTARMWHLDLEANPPAWFSSIQLWAIATILGVAAWREFAPRRLAWWALAVAAFGFAFLSADEAAMLHERIGALTDRAIGPREGSGFDRTGFWMFVLAPPAVAAAATIAWGAWAYLRLDRVALAIGVAGAMLFVGAAAGVEAASNRFPPGQGNLYSVLVEELGEMMGATLMLWATCRYARRIDLRLAPPRAERFAGV